MANSNLQSFADSMRSDYGEAWDELDNVISQMQQDFSQDDREEFRECVEDRDRGDIVPCLTDKAEELGIASTFRRRIANSGVVGTLRSAGREAAQRNNASEETRNAANFGAVSDLNKMCANPNIETSEIEERLSEEALMMVGGSIDSYTDCVTATSEHANLSNDLKSAYGTD